MSAFNQLIQIIKSRLTNSQRPASRKDSQKGREFIEVGFHDDEYLLRLVDNLIAPCDWFIETGTNVGSTLAYVARTYPDVQCLSCEPEVEAFKEAQKNTNPHSNVTIYNEDSQSFIERLESDYSFLFSHEVLFWVDAHGFGFDWPLREEVAFISSHFQQGYVLIDDFKVPENEEFGYDVYEDQECSMDYVEDVIDDDWNYRLYYPDYTEHTSPHHPLRGWGLFAFGNDLLELPNEVGDLVYLAE